MKTKSERKKLIKRLDTQVSLLVRQRDGKCFTCGTTINLQCGHLFSRASYSTRWDLVNCNAQCASCNLRHEYNPHIYTNAFIDHYGLKIYKQLYKRHAEIKKWSNRELQELLDRFIKLSTG